MREKMITCFKEAFGDTDNVKTYFAPGRVNLIGEHTDYNGGHVFPCALTIGTYAAVRLRKDRGLRFYSENFREKRVVISSLDELIYHRKDDWANYPKGVFWAFAHCPFVSNSIAFDKMQYGIDIAFYGNIPNSSGLSSSASIEVLMAYIIRDLYHIDIDLINIAKLSQYAENNFIGVNCGIMDQFAIAMGKKGHAIFLDTASLKYEYAPIELGDAKLVIACSNKKRGLGDSKYNERRNECEEALRRLMTVTSINSLGDLSNEKLLHYKKAIGDETLLKRARHAVSENIRTLEAVTALKDNNLDIFGRLMNESHESLRNDYEVTGVELDTLVEAAWNQQGVIGARMTGAGFGGCTVNLVKEVNIEDFILNVGGIYQKRIGYKADFYIVDIGGGPSKNL